MRKTKFIIEMIEIITLSILAVLSVVGLISWINTVIDDNPITVEASSQECPFVTVYKDYDYEVVYYKDSKVMYVKDPLHDGRFTVLVNPDGTPMIFEEE